MHSCSKSKIAVKMLSLVVVCLVALSFACSCSDVNKIKNNIEITPEQESYAYDDTTISYAKNVIYTCLYNYETAKSGDLSQKEIEELQRKAEMIQESIPCTVNQETYKLLLFTLSTNSKEIASGLHMIRGEEGKQGFTKLKDTYFAITGIVDDEYVAGLVYNIILATLDGKYQSQMEAYEKYGYQYMLDKADEYVEMKLTVENEIGKDNIRHLIKYFFLFGDLYYGTAFESEALKSFTDEEVLIFIKAIDLSGITITQKGYELLISSYGESAVGNKNKTFFDKVMFEAYRNGDSERMAEFAREAVSLLAEAQENLKLEDISMLKEGEGALFLYKLAERFDDEDWARFDKACTGKINTEEYNKIAKEYYGEDFESYLQSHKGATIDELKASCGTDIFNQTLKEYIFGICPAFSYNMNL